MAALNDFSTSERDSAPFSFRPFTTCTMAPPTAAAAATTPTPMRITLFLSGELGRTLSKLLVLSQQRLVLLLPSRRLFLPRLLPSFLVDQADFLQVHNNLSRCVAHDAASPYQISV